MNIALRGLFIATILVVIYFFISHASSLNISSDLKSLSPGISNDKPLQQAIDTLSSDIEQRLILVLTSDNTEELNKAVEFLNRELRNIKSLQLSAANDVAKQVTSILKPYRFGLLSTEQQAFYKQANEQQILEQATQELYALNTVRVLDFHEDPFNDFTRYITQTINPSDAQNVSPNHHAFYIRINAAALDIQTQENLLNKFTSIEQELNTTFPSVNLLRSGVFFFAADAATKSKRDISMISTGSSIGVLLILLLAFRSLRPLLLALTCVGAGVASAFAITHWVTGGVHIITIVFGASLIGVVIDYALHYVYFQAANHTSNKKQLYRALTLSLITSIIGYSALSLSSLDSLQTVALFSCVGLASAWLSVMVLAPILLTDKITVNSHLVAHLLSPLLSIVIKPISRFLPVFLIALIAFSALSAGWLLAANDNPTAFFTPSPSLLEQEKKVSQQVDGSEPGQYLVARSTNIETLYTSVNQYSESLPASANHQLTSIHQWLPSPDMQQRNHALLTPLYKPQGIATDWLTSLQLEQTSIQQLTGAYANFKPMLPQQFIQQAEQLLPPLWVQVGDTYFSFLLINKNADLAALQQAANQHSNIDYIHSTNIATTALRDQRMSSSRLLIFAYLLIAIILMVRYRDVKRLWMLAIPISATLTVLSLMALLSMPVTIFHVMALFLVLGLGMDYVVFIAEIDSHTDLTTQAIVLSALTSLLSFGLLALSSIPIVHAFGFTVLIGNSVNLIGALVYAHRRKT